MIASPEVESIRAEIPATASLTYLKTGWQRPSPRSVIAAVRETFDMEAHAPKVSHHAADHYDFQGGFRPKVDAIDKFDLTTVSVPLLAGLLAAVEFVQGIDLETVTSGLVSFSLPNLPPEVMTACLWERGRIVARTVPDAKCTRFCLHVFNTETEVDEALTIVDDLARSGPPTGEFPSVALEHEAMTEL